jgi:hypothetical protein
MRARKDPENLDVPGCFRSLVRSGLFFFIEYRRHDQAVRVDEGNDDLSIR